MAMSARDILTEEELNTLLNEELGAIPVPERAVQDGVPLNFYDFISEYHKSITKTKGFMHRHASFITHLKNKLNKLTNQHWHMVPHEVEVTTCEQYLKNAQPGHLNVVKLNTANRLVLCAFDRTLINGAVESLFGGDAANIQPGDHSSGIINTMLNEKLTQAISESLQHTWQPILDFDFTRLDSQDDAILSKLHNSDNKIIVCHYQCQFQQTNVRFDVCLPHCLITSVSDQLNQDEQATNHSDSLDEWRDALTHNVNNANISLSAEIAETQIKLAQALKLQVGDVITVDNPHLGYLLAEGMKLYKMKCASRDGTKVVELLEPIQY